MPPKYHKFPPGERCEECGTRQWYAENALRYCRNGHLQEGFAEHSGDEDDFGTQGKTTRKKKEKREKVAVKLTGDLGRELYLEVLQLVLRKQLWWLVKEWGFPEELEGIVKSLWSLRIRQLPLKVANLRGENRTVEDEDGDAISMSSSMTGKSVSRGGGYSSQSEGGGATSDWDSDAATSSTWQPDLARRWKMPKMIDTLALCYLGCLTRRIPVSTASFHHWANEGKLEYLAALTNLPRDVRDRLPPEFHRALQVGDHIKPGRLQAAVEDLILAFKSNCNITFPPVNHVYTVISYIRDLVLPLDVYPVVTAIAKILKTEFRHPADGLRRKAMRDPEVLMIVLVVVSTKLCCPFQDPAHEVDRNTMDWSAWCALRQKKVDDEHILPGIEHSLTANDVVSMNGVKVDDYMDWFEKMFIGDGNAGTAEALQKPFMGEPRASDPRPDRSLDTIIKENDSHTKQQYRELNNSKPRMPAVRNAQRLQDANSLWSPIWRRADEMPDTARFFHEQAAGLGAISLSTLIRACAQVERRLEIWCEQRSRDKKGKETAKESPAVQDVALV